MGDVFVYEGVANAHGKFGGLILPDTTPDAFNFSPVTGAALSTEYTSSVTIAGISAAASISIVDGEYKIDDGSYTAAPGAVSSGQVVTVRVTSSDDEGEAVSATLTVGGVSGTFSVTTATDATLLAYADWSTHGLTPPDITSGYRWATWSGDGQGPMEIEDGAIKMNYLNSVVHEGNAGNVALYIEDESIDLTDVWITFQAKIPNEIGGFKFLKIFGRNVGGNYANVTMPVDYSAMEVGAVAYFAFGDGTEVPADTAHFIRFDGADQAGSGRNHLLATILLPQGEFFHPGDWGDGFHTFRVRIKFNDGTTPENEINNGVLYLEIDGQVFCDAQFVFNRPPTAPVGIESIGFGGWSQSINHDFEAYFKDIKVSTGGFMP